MKNCELIKKNLSQYLSHTLSEQLTEKITKHIDNCAKCRKYLQSHQNLDNILNNIIFNYQKHSNYQNILSRIKQNLIGSRPKSSDNKFTQTADNTQTLTDAELDYAAAAGEPNDNTINFLFPSQLE